jgi:2-oxoglutarate dehydrogenase complex dehydrogenase (E1) component-like enzyme
LRRHIIVTEPRTYIPQEGDLVRTLEGVSMSEAPASVGALVAEPLVDATDQGSHQPDESKKPDEGKVLRSGVSAKAASALGVQARLHNAQQRRVTESESIRAALSEQVRISTLRDKGTTAASRTAAARAIPELQAALRDAEEREQREGRIDWDAMSGERLALMRHVLDATDEEISEVLRHLEEQKERA